MAIHQGDVYWIDRENAGTLIPHPHVVIQPDDLNHDPAVPTVVVCAVTTNLKKLQMPGNVLLEPGEANLPRPSIVEVSKVLTLDKAHLGERIGTLSQQRLEQITAGMRFVRNSFFRR